MNPTVPVGQILHNCATTTYTVPYQGPPSLTNASGIFFEHDDRVFLVASRHVLIDKPTRKRTAHSEKGYIMTYKKNFTSRGPSTIEPTSPAPVDGTDDGRSQNDVMREHAPRSIASDNLEIPQAERVKDRLHFSTSASKPAPEGTPAIRSESMKLEGRVLAHEQILQALIAHMTETEPRFLERLTQTFCVPMQMALREHDYTDTESYAEEFIRTVIRLGERRARKSPETVRAHPLDHIASSDNTGDSPSSITPSRFQISNASGVWRVTKDGHFYGNYFEERHALEAVEGARSDIAQSS